MLIKYAVLDDEGELCYFVVPERSREERVLRQALEAIGYEFELIVTARKPTTRRTKRVQAATDD